MSLAASQTNHDGTISGDPASHWLRITAGDAQLVVVGSDNVDLRFMDTSWEVRLRPDLLIELRE